MSNSGNIEQVRERVLQMARQIENLSRSDNPPDEFFPEFLQLLMSALGAQAGAVWLRDANNRLNLSHEIGLSETGFLDNPQAHSLNQNLLSNVIATGEAASYSPQDELDTKLPTDNLHILAALQVEKQGVGVVQIFQRSDAPADARPGFLQFVEQMCGYASRFLERKEQGTSARSPEEFWRDFERFTLQLQQSLNVNEVSATAVNDARLLLGCDRLSVAVIRGKKISINAVSGQDTVNPRANLVRAMVSMASKVMAMRESILFTGRIEHLAPQIEVPLASFVQESGSRMVMVIPLFENDPLVPQDDEEQRRKEKTELRKVVGCLIIEQISKSEPQPGLLERVDMVADHVAASLYNARSHQQIFLLRFWRFLGRTLEWFRGRKLAKTVAVLAVLVAIGMGLVLIPMDYKIEGKGELMPVRQRSVFAKVSGEVEKIFVKDGDVVKGDVVKDGVVVKPGTKLLQLRNPELELDLLTAQNQLRVDLQQEVTLTANINAGVTSSRRDEVIRLRGERLQIQSKIEGGRTRVAKLQERVGKLTVTAPIDGTVVTFRLDQLLINRPVQQGETLVEIMDESGDWRVELEVAEKRMGHILRAQEDLETQNLNVEYVPATSSEKTYPGKIQEMATRSESSEEGSVVEIFISTDPNNLPERRIGAEVSAKINCGKRSLGYVLFGDVIEAAQRYFFVWL